MSLELTEYAVKIELIEDLLGTIPKDKEVYANYIAAKGREILERNAAKGVPVSAGDPTVKSDGVAALLEEEVETIQEVEERGWTGFHADLEGSFLFDYTLKGFLCEAARTLKQIGNVKQLQDKFKRYVFVRPRKIRLPDPDGVNERPLRAMTAQGPRVTVTRSDVVKAGAVLEFRVAILEGGGITVKILRDVLEYGELIGLGQWRTGGWGRFTLLELEEV